MIKSIALLRRRADLSREAFIDYYERHHAPLILSLMPGIVDYRRNFATFEGAFVNDGAAPFDFDVVTELWFADQATYDAAIAAATAPDVAARIAADEENFLDRTGTRMFVVEERRSAMAPVMPPSDHP